MFYMLLPATVVVFAIRNQSSLRKYEQLPIPATEIDLKRKVAYLQGMPRHARRTAPCAEPWRQRGFPMLNFPLSHMVYAMIILCLTVFHTVT